jgi:DNA modification methylase
LFPWIDTIENPLGMKNTLFYGDNLDVLRRHVDEESVDLIYLDPPFNSDQDFNVLFREHDGTKAAAQVLAFGDTWEWNSISAETCERVIEAGGPPSLAIQSFRQLLGTSDMMAYLAMMAPRLIELRRSLKPSGSIYLHCDPTASHYLKLLMDAIFGPINFRNEIIWRRSGSHNSARRYGPIHDTILFYSKDKDYFWKKQYRPYLQKYIDSFFNKEDENGRFRSQTLTGSGTRNGASGRPWRGVNPTDKGRHWAFPGVLAEELGLEDTLSLHEKLDVLWKENLIASTVDGLPEYRQYLSSSKGLPLQDVWSYQPYTNGVLHGSDEAIDQDVKWLEKRGSKERLGYPTQKAQGLLERIILASSKEGDTILDPFCGCGTAIEAAHKLGRSWIGIDVTHLSVSLIKFRLQNAFGDEIRKQYGVVGEPVSLPDAQSLAREDPYQFQYWALGLVGARPTEQKKGADQGIDGRIFFHDDSTGRARQIVLSVKSGDNLTPAFVRDLRGVVEREKAEIGVLITLRQPSREMRREASGAGFYKSNWGTHPKLQILTVKELLSGENINRPPTRDIDATLKKRVRSVSKAAEQLRLLN